jgi:glucose/mannose-6-phosphate isomerase
LSGLEKMVQLVDSLPQQLVDGYNRGLAANFPLKPGKSPPMIFGMGGSGIAGELLSTLASEIGSTPIISIRSFSFPKWAGKGVPAVFVSYSGNTAETLRVYKEAGKRGLDRVVLTSGGALLEMARKDGVPSVVVPPGNPPRASLGYLFGALFGLLNPLFPGHEHDLPVTAEELRSLASDMKGEWGWPARVASAWGDRELWVYVPERLVAVGRRWKTQSEENAKRLAHFDTVPELMHNALVAWDSLPKGVAGKRLVVMLSGPRDGKEIMTRMEYLSGVIEGIGCPLLHIRLGSLRPLTEILEGVWIGDYASLREAQSTGVDPLPVVAIDKMKAKMPHPEEEM